nr:Putative uncharacterized protein [Moritella viscosa]SHN98029.1 Putative uncharacterized protein [Moritella viscosa]SHN99525.1 Putative uncharacterized protein [Moritella viscosa]
MDYELYITKSILLSAIFRYLNVYYNVKAGIYIDSWFS